jgi:hypothetical protein
MTLPRTEHASPVAFDQAISGEQPGNARPRASVGSTEASTSFLARVGVVGPTRAV